MVVIAFITIFVVFWLAIIAGFTFIAPFITNFFPGQEFQSILVGINLLFFIGIPLVMVVIGVSSIAFQTKMGKGWKTAMGLLWLVNAISLFSIGGSLAQNFAVEGEMTETISTEEFVSDTVRFGFYKFEDIEERHFHFGTNSIEMPSTRVYISVKKSEDSDWHLEQKISSRGKSLDDAEGLARSLVIPLQMEKGQLLMPKEIPFTEIEKWRAQEVVLTAYVPVGAVLSFDETFPRRSRGLFHNGPRKFRKNPNSFYKMEADGLVCLDCPVEEKIEEDAQEMETSNESSENQINDIGSFSRLSFSGPIKVSVTRGDEYDVRVNAPARYKDRVNVENTGDGQMLIHTDLDRVTAPIRVYITMPELSELVIENTDDVLIKDFDSEHLRIVSAGDFELKADITAQHLDVALSEGNKFEFIGGTDVLTAVLKGEARMDTDRGYVKDANLDISEGSRIKMNHDTNILTQDIEEGSEVRIRD